MIQIGQRWRYLTKSSYDFVVEITSNAGACVVLQDNEYSIRSGYKVGTKHCFEYLAGDSKYDGSGYGGWWLLKGQDKPQ